MNMKRIAFAVLAVSGIASALILHAKPAVARSDNREWVCEVIDSSGTLHCGWQFVE